MQNLYFPPFSQGAPTQTRQHDQREHQYPIHLNNVFTLHAQRSSVKESLGYTTLQLPRQSHRHTAPSHRVCVKGMKEGARERNTWCILSNACPIFVLPQIVQSLRNEN